MTRNQKYEHRKKESGFVKVTIWVPVDVESDFKEMARRCCEEGDLYPVACRSKKTGQLRYL